MKPVPLVINFDFPSSSARYLRRVGRSGSKKGVALSSAESSDASQGQKE